MLRYLEATCRAARASVSKTSISRFTIQRSSRRLSSTNTRSSTISIATKMTIKNITLGDGSSAPWIAFGTGTALYNQPVTDAVLLAIERGFKHLDGAQVYNNEDTLGDAIVKSGKKRDELYITTKLFKLEGETTVGESLKGSLKKLKVEYVDLFLIHMPGQFKEGTLGNVWKGLVESKKQGLAKAIGVSNFTVKHLEEIKATGLELPAVNQIELHPFVFHALVPLLEYHAKNGITSASYGGLTPILPRSAKDLEAKFPKQRAKLVSALDSIASARPGTVTQNQVLLKWLDKKGALAVTTSSSAERIDGYLAVDKIADLTDEEATEIENAVKGATFRAFPLFSYMDDQSF